MRLSCTIWGTGNTGAAAPPRGRPGPARRRSSECWAEAQRTVFARDETEVWQAARLRQGFAPLPKPIWSKPTGVPDAEPIPADFQRTFWSSSRDRIFRFTAIQAKAGTCPKSVILREGERPSRRTPTVLNAPMLPTTFSEDSQYEPQAAIRRTHRWGSSTRAFALAQNDSSKPGGPV